MLTELIASVRGAIAGQTARLVANEKAELLVAQGLPKYAELVRRGNVWSAMNTSALAALVVRRSTVANFTLFNNEPEGGKSYVLLRAFAFNLVSTAAEARSGLWLCVHPKGLVTPTDDITARGSAVGKANYGGRAKCDTAMTVTDNGWFPWGPFSTVEPTGALPGAVMCADVAGLIVVPPQCGVSTQVVSSGTGKTFTSGFSWLEEQLFIE